MSLFLHLSIHALLSILIGVLAGLYFKKLFILIITALVFGFFIDLDHFLEFILFFKSFHLLDFLNNQQFIISGKTFLYFHAWEWVFLLLILAWIFWRRYLWRAILITASLSLFVHLVSDCFINRFPFEYYSITHRARHDFLVEKLIN